MCCSAAIAPCGPTAPVGPHGPTRLLWAHGSWQATPPAGADPPCSRLPSTRQLRWLRHTLRPLHQACLYKVAQDSGCPCCVNIRSSLGPGSPGMPSARATCSTQCTRLGDPLLSEPSRPETSEPSRPETSMTPRSDAMQAMHARVALQAMRAVQGTKAPLGMRAVQGASWAWYRLASS